MSRLSCIVGGIMACAAFHPVVAQESIHAALDTFCSEVSALRKGDYETTVEFERRRQSWAANWGTRVVRIVSEHPSSMRRVYDADRETLELRFGAPCANRIVPNSVLRRSGANGLMLTATLSRAIAEAFDVQKEKLTLDVTFAAVYVDGAIVLRPERLLLRRSSSGLSQFLALWVWP